MSRTPELVSEVLQRYGSATREGLKKYLPSSSANRHLYELLADYPSRGGKMMRPSICIATARAFGASLDDCALLRHSHGDDAQRPAHPRRHPG